MRAHRREFGATCREEERSRAVSSKYPNLEKLSRLVDDAVEAVLNMTDEEVLEQLGNPSDDPYARVDALKKKVNEQVSVQRRSRLIAARAAIDAEQAAPVVPIRNMSRDQLVDALVSIIEKHGNTDLTMAARDGNGMSDEDLASYLEDMQELGYFDENGS